MKEVSNEDYSVAGRSWHWQEKRDYRQYQTAHRNYLFPRKWAMEATPNAVKEVGAARRERAEEAARVGKPEEVARKINGKTVEIKAKSGDEDACMAASPPGGGGCHQIPG